MVTPYPYLPYKGIDQVMDGLREQIIDSVQWCYNNIPVMENPKQLYDYLKARVKFKDDEQMVETIQSAQTLFENNVHGVSGFGDCDCFTCLASAAFIAQGWGNIDIVLAGRSKRNPVHIYNYITFKGQTYCFDLTEPRFNQERPYSLTQVLPITFYKN